MLQKLAISIYLLNPKIHFKIDETILLIGKLERSGAYEFKRTGYDVIHFVHFKQAKVVHSIVFKYMADTPAKKLIVEVFSLYLMERN